MSVMLVRFVLAAAFLSGCAAAARSASDADMGTNGSAADLGTKDFASADLAGSDLGKLSCGDVTENGTCNGNVRTWCSGGNVVMSTTCAGSRQCVTDPSGMTACHYVLASQCGNDVTAARQCDGNNLVWCDNTGLINVYECPVNGMTCGMVFGGGYDCK